MNELKKNKLHVDLRLLRSNVSQLQELNKNRFFCPMVKANAYGHGDKEISRVLVEAGVQWLGVATLNEGLQLRKHLGGRTNILVFEAFDKKQLPHYQTNNLTPVLSTFEHINFLLENKNLSNIRFHVKFDTGMNRVGIPFSQAEQFKKQLQDNGILKNLDGVCSHFSNAEEQDAIHKKQITKCQTLHRLFENDCQRFHFWNSAGLLAKSQNKKLDALPWGSRPGLAIYGIWPRFSKKVKTQIAKKVSLLPISKLTSKVIALHDLKRGEGVSYSTTWRAARSTQVATLAIGYADGIPVSLSNKGIVMIEGRRAKVAGRVCMDYTIIEVPRSVKINLFDEVCFYDSGENAQLTIEEMSRSAGTISYEIAVRCGERVDKIYHE